MKTSLRYKLIGFIALAIALTIFSCMILNKLFLEQYYTDKKKRTIKETFESINVELTAIENEELTSEQRELLDKSEVLSNVEIYVFTDVQRTTDFGTLYFTHFVYPLSTSINDIGANGMPGAWSRTDNREIVRVLDAYSNYLFPRANGITQNVRTLESTDRYKIMAQHDTSVDSDFIDIFGTLDNGYVCIVRVASQSIGEAVSIANRFMYLSGAFMIVIAIFITLLFSRRFTKPIIELSNIAERMSNLDFDAKYPVTTEDEIGVLGNSMNSLSTTLEKTISELKGANIQLLSDIEEKEKIDNMRTEFISNVTHELKTPIALIQGYAEGLKDCINDDAESREFYCDVIMDEADKMNKMVKSLLSLSKIESGGIPLDIQHFNLNDVISQVLASVDILIKKSGAVIEFDNSKPCCVWADEYMTEEVVTNYISNALHHVDGERIIRVNTEHVGETVRFSVFNTGTPIADEDIENIWTKFYKADKARTREYGGTGIGLSIVKAVMDAHHRPYGVINHEDGVEFWAEFDCSNK